MIKKKLFQKKFLIFQVNQNKKYEKKFFYDGKFTKTF